MTRIFQGLMRYAYEKSSAGPPPKGSRWRISEPAHRELLAEFNADTIDPWDGKRLLGMEVETYPGAIPAWSLVLPDRPATGCSRKREEEAL